MVHAVLEESEVGLVPGLEPLHLLTGQLPHVFLHDSRGVAPLGGVPHLVAAHHVRQAGEAEHQVLLLPLLQVDDVGEVGQAGGAVLSVEAPVKVLPIRGDYQPQSGGEKRATR